MKLEHIHIKNYRGLRDVNFPVSNFGCLIGENNAGKSSVLTCLSLFFSGTALRSSRDRYEPELPVRIQIRFAGVCEEDLARLAPEHRAKMEPLVRDGRITLVRVYGDDGKSSLKVIHLVPDEPRFEESQVNGLVAKKSGKVLAAAILDQFPELEDQISSKTTIQGAKDAIMMLAEKMPNEGKIPRDRPLPTGVDKSIYPMLPEPLYIPAVKNLADDIKTTETTPLGRLLTILLGEISGKLEGSQSSFKELQGLLNRPDEGKEDQRLSEVKLIERTIEQFVQESFPRVVMRLDVPPPELKTILNGARLKIHDGIEGELDSKGDGLKRSVIFAILRAHHQLKQKGAFGAQDDGWSSSGRPYLLLFEEPELYLYPRAQRQLFEALRSFSQENQVVVTTHSPMFLGPNATETFVKLRKCESAASPPFTKVQVIDLRSSDSKTQFQIICYENNSAAFFSDSVLLVEGDSDYIVIPHLAQLLNPEWHFGRHPVSVARVGGKSSFGRYRKFFNQFDVRVAILADLDVLVKDFDQLGASKFAQAKCTALLAEVDKVLGLQVESKGGPSASSLRDTQASSSLKVKWENIEQKWVQVDNGQCEWGDLSALVQSFFSVVRRQDRLEIIAKAENESVKQLKDQLLALLRSECIYVLEHGEIENYYPADIGGRDKPSNAQSFCEKVTCRADVLRLPVFDGNNGVCEFDSIFKSLLDIS